MFIADIKRIVEQVSRDKGIDRNVLITALEEAIKSAARKKFGSKIDIEVQYDEESGEIEVFQFKEVVETIDDPLLQISVKEGLKLDAESVAGDSLGTKMDTSTFGRIAAQSAKQVIIQKMKDAERDAVYSSFIGRKGEIINGIVQRFDRRDIIVNLGNTESILPYREQVPKETYHRGERIRAYIKDILHDTRGPQIVLSRVHPNFLIELFKTEVPEISEGIVSIMGAVRESGIRAKFSVSSNDSDIDPVGACVGMKGSRVQNVVQELRGEKIDIISWHVDPAKYVCNALAPAEISRVIIDEEDRSMEVIVPEEFLSIAIGKSGQNVRLASKLTNWRLDVISEERYSKAMQDGYDSLTALSGVGISVADALYESGFYSAEELSKASVDDLIQLRGIGEEKAKKLVEVAKNYLDLAQNSATEANAAAECGPVSEEEDNAGALEKDVAPESNLLNEQEVTEEPVGTTVGEPEEQDNTAASEEDPEKESDLLGESNPEEQDNTAASEEDPEKESDLLSESNPEEPDND